MKTAIPEMKSSNQIAQVTRSQAANGKKCLRNQNLQDLVMFRSLFQIPMKSVIEQLNNHYNEIDFVRVFVSKNLGAKIQTNCYINDYITNTNVN